MKKIRVGIIFGGKSAEHEVSLQSAKSVFEAMDKNKYEPVLIGIDKAGKWLLGESSNFLLNSDDPKLIKLNESNKPVALVPQSEGKISNLTNLESEKFIDVVFPLLHGPFGEDGTVQGLLKLADIPFVGVGVLGSAIGMDKDVSKRLLRDAGIVVANFLAVNQGENLEYEKIIENLGLPFFVKPANLGSSVGINKVKNKDEFEAAILEAFRYDTKIVIEENIVGREIECAVLGNNDPQASILGEVIPKHDFYSYEAKYIDEDGAVLEIPAKVVEDKAKEIQALAVKVFKVLNCEGMSRVDFFLESGGRVVVNEINTIPGFTKISMYPKLWEATGIGYSELIDRLIGLAIERFQKEKKLKNFYQAE